MNDVKRMEDKFNSLMDKYLSVVNSEIKHYEKEKSVAIENYAYELARHVLSLIKDKYNINIDVSIIADGTQMDLNKVIINYNTKYENEIINYTKIEDIFLDSDTSVRDRCKNILDYLNDLKKSYLLEDKFISNLNEIFAKRITTRILNTKPDISKDDSIRLLNNVYALVKNKTFGLINKINNYYTTLNSNVIVISQKLSEAMAQVELLKPYMGEESVTRESRVEKYKDCLEEDDGDNLNKEGFTLVELLAVIVVLSIIAIVSATVIFKLINDSRKSIYNENVALIEKAAEKWSVENVDLVGTTTPYCLNVNELVNGGYMEANNLKDPREKGNKNITGYVKISYDSTYKQYEYDYVGTTCN